MTTDIDMTIDCPPCSGRSEPADAHGKQNTGVAGVCTYRHLLQAAGRDPLAPGTCATAVDRTVALWELLAALGRQGLYFTHTDHLDDGTLYAFLLREVLPMEVDACGEDPESARYIDMLDWTPGNDTELYLRHYASDFVRQNLLSLGLVSSLPEASVPPCNRDRFLPTGPSID